MDQWIGTTGFVLATIAYLLLLLLLLLTRIKPQQRWLLTLTLLASGIWAVCFALSEEYSVPTYALLALEAIRNSAWFVVLASVLYRDKPFIQLVFSSVSSVAISLFVVVTLLVDLSIGLTSYSLSATALILHLSQSIFALWLIEQLYRRTEQTSRWTIKPLCLGLGLMFTYDLAFYADAVLVKSIDSDFLAGRGWIALVSAPLILLSVRRIRHWSIRVYVSRNVLYHSTILMVCGGYLVAMSLSGYLIRYLGISWTDAAQYIFLALSGLILASLFLSEYLRNQLKVFIAKHFYENKYEYREEWMRFVSVLDDTHYSPYEVSLRALMKPFQCASGAFVEIRDQRIFSRASLGIDIEGKEDVLGSLAVQAIEHDWIIDIDELKSGKAPNPIKIDEESLIGLDKVKYIVPIAGIRDGKAVCLLSALNSSRKLDWEDRDLMTVISRQLSVYLNLHATNQKLAENQQFDAFNQMSTFLVHDLKNVIAQLELLSKNAQKHKDNPEFIEDAFITVESATARLNKAVSQLRNKQVHRAQAELVDVGGLLQEVSNERKHALPPPVCNISEQGELLVSADRDRLKNVFLHLIQNAQDATDASGSVTISQIRDEQMLGICIEDNGEGMTEEFILNRLFKPFDTTKGNAGMGVGAYDAKQFIEQLNGKLQVFSQPGKGTRFEVYLPKVS